MTNWASLQETIHISRSRAFLTCDYCYLYQITLKLPITLGMWLLEFNEEKIRSW